MHLQYVCVAVFTTITIITA